MDKNGNLVLKNVGRRPVYVHGKPLLTGQSTKLEHRQVIEVQAEHVVTMMAGLVLRFGVCIVVECDECGCVCVCVREWVGSVNSIFHSEVKFTCC